MKIKIPLQVVKLEEGNYHLVISGKLSDEKVAYWAVDTGASKTVFDKNLQNHYFPEISTEEIHSVGIGENPMICQNAILKPFLLGNFKVENLNVAIINLSSINKYYSRAANFEICGLIGGDFLMKHKAVIDYKRKIITLNI
jgi:hypothetical protein